MTNLKRIKINDLQVADAMYHFIENELLPESGVSSEQLWSGISSLVNDLAPKNRELLAKRYRLQNQIDDWHINSQHINNQHSDNDFELQAYKAFLNDIGYLEADIDNFNIVTDNVDDEIALQAGPQLVVPVKNARFALNACNARWGSLYDALYGTDVIAENNGAERVGAYNPVRGNKVIAYARHLLDEIIPLTQGSHINSVGYSINDNNQLAVKLDDDSESTLISLDKLVGYQGEQKNPSAILVVNNDLHVVIVINRQHPIGSTDKAGVSDLLMEAAVTTIMDCEDSVAAVDCDDKIEVYRNWLGLMKGTLDERFEKGGEMVHRQMNDDTIYQRPQGGDIRLHGRSMLLVRNVGHLMTNNAILDKNNVEIPEGIMDAVMTSLAAKHNLDGNTQRINSRSGSVYIVKPKMHGSEEVAFSCELFRRVEQILGLADNTLKIGIMDEERRTTLNLKQCIHAAKQRVVFINTGFLDRTGDEIHTSMQAGAVVAKTSMKQQQWIDAYERWNVETGIQCGLPGKAQIGKGMWAMPDEMNAMMEQKGNHPQSGASTAWVPSPNGATLHSMHYHQISVKQRQRVLADRIRSGHLMSRDEILTIPLLDGDLSAEQIQFELDNNAQGILGYVVRWVDSGVGCSKVPDINGVGLMEDRATLRISSQHLANWLLHGVCTEQQVMESLKRMAVVVDEQNATDPYYQPMAPNYDGLAFKAACDLIFKGCEQPSGYTEPLLHQYRLQLKAL